jgi:transcriptional regulator NrdR family protein
MDSRPASKGGGDAIRRRRGCSDCKADWTTYEIEASAFEAMMAKLDDYAQLTKALARVMPEIKAALPEIRTRAVPQDGRK